MVEGLSPRSRPLTARQAEVLTLVANGCTARRVAERLWVSVDTVNTVLRNAYRNLGVSSGAQAVAVALRLGLIPLEAVTLPEAVSAAVRPVGGPVGPEGRGVTARPSVRDCVSDLGAA